MCYHQAGGSEATVIEPQIENKQVVVSVHSAERKAEHGPRGRAVMLLPARRRTHHKCSGRAGCIPLL